MASSDPAAGGSYSLALDLQPLVALGDATVSGDVAAGERGDVYLLDADGPQVATISVRANPPLAVRADVLGPDGGPVTSAKEASDGEDVAFAVRLIARGPYVVRVPHLSGPRRNVQPGRQPGPRVVAVLLAGHSQRSREGGGRISQWTTTADRSTTSSTRRPRRHLRDGNGPGHRVPRRPPVR